MNEFVVVDDTDQKTRRSAIRTGELVVNLDTRLVSVDDRAVHLSDKERHQLLHLKSEYGGAISSHGVDEVPLRKYADRFHPAILYYQSADAMLRQLADREFDDVRGVYPHNVMALGP